MLGLPVHHTWKPAPNAVRSPLSFAAIERCAQCRLQRSILPLVFVAAFARYTGHNTDDVGIHRQNRRTAYEIVTARASSRRFRQAAPMV
jgi:hypothetical protein